MVEKKTILALEFLNPDTCKNKDKILKFTDNSRKSLKLADVPLDQAVYT